MLPEGGDWVTRRDSRDQVDRALFHYPEKKAKLRILERLGVVGYCEEFGVALLPDVLGNGQKIQGGEKSPKIQAHIEAMEEKVEELQLATVPVEEAVASLPDDLQRLIESRWFQKLSRDEILDIMGMGIRNYYGKMNYLYEYLAVFFDLARDGADLARMVRNVRRNAEKRSA